MLCSGTLAAGAIQCVHHERSIVGLVRTTVYPVYSSVAFSHAINDEDDEHGVQQQ